jgi:hypothetical protein
MRKIGAQNTSTAASRRDQEAMTLLATYCLKLRGRLLTLRGVPGWEANAAKHRLGLGDALLKKHIEDLKRLVVERNSAGASQSSRYDGDEDEDAELVPMRPESLEDKTKHPFACMAEDLKFVFSLLTGEEEEEIENFAGIDIATPKTPCQNWDVDQQRRNSNSNLNTMVDVRTREQTS